MAAWVSVLLARAAEEARSASKAATSFPVTVLKRSSSLRCSSVSPRNRVTSEARELRSAQAEARSARRRAASSAAAWRTDSLLELAA